ncbi:centromere kinetochore component CENP-T-domain-containing protein [Lipomyces orientalis]|uniref:Centromere kinetochore component CENP-T-domain-containing protein n=1 Tax=Lipomyces orientalis TaxID=1233043 RepID=A0ACC3TJ36_9ASCO
MDRDRFLAVSTPRRAQQQTPLQQSAHRTSGSRTPFTRTRPVRHNILTPGRERRRSGIFPARKTPRDDLRLLSRLLKRPSPRLSEQPLPKRLSQSSVTSRPSISVQLDDYGNEEDELPQLPAIIHNDAEREDEEEDERQLRHPPLVSVGGDEDDEQDMSAYSLESARRMTAEPRSSLDRRRLPVSDVDGNVTADESTQFVIRPLQDEEIPLDYNELRDYSGYDDDRNNPIDDYNEYEDTINRERLQEEFSMRAENRKINSMSLDSAISAKSTSSKRARPKKLEQVLPKKLIKDLIKNLSSFPVSTEALQTVTDASDMFVKQTSSDLAKYAQHANRKTIDESDVLMLMKRQRQLTPKVTVFGLAHKYLPSELLAELRLPNTDNARSAKEHEKFKSRAMKKRQRMANEKESMLAE